MKARVVVGLLLAAAAAVVLVLTFRRSSPHRVTPHVALSTSSVVALGDSVPAGEACACTPYASLLGQLRSAATHRPFTARDLAQDGLTSLGLLQQVTRDRLHADGTAITVVTIGANDFDSQVLSTSGCRTVDQLACYASDLAAMTANVDRVLALLTSGRHGPVLVTGYWNVFLDGPVGSAQGAAYARDSDALTLQVNAALAHAARKHGARYVDLYAPFKTAVGGEAALLAADGDHPSARGHALIARLLEASLEAHPS